MDASRQANSAKSMDEGSYTVQLFIQFYNGSQLPERWKKWIEIMLWTVLVVGVAVGGGAVTTTTTSSDSASPLPPTNGHSLSGASSGLVVRTAQGLVRGLASRGTRQWLGLPYAAPPVGPLR